MVWPSPVDPFLSPESQKAFEESESFLTNEITMHENMLLTGTSQSDFTEDFRTQKSDMDRLFKERRNKTILCMRCHLIQNGHFAEAKNIDTKIMSMPRNRFLTSIFERLKPKTIIVLVVDISDFDASFPEDFLDHLVKKEAIVYLVCNKIDTLPEDGIGEGRLRGWVKARLQEKSQFFQGFQLEKIFLVSSTNGKGVKKFLRYFENEAKNRANAGDRDYIYVMGNANVGKSSFLNQLRVQSKKNTPATYKDPFDLRLSGEEKKTPHDPNKNTQYMEGKINQLTVSVMPGTTLKPQRVEKIAIGNYFWFNKNLSVQIFRYPRASDPNASDHTHSRHQ
jgi:GTP-binding protein EngB required for normal cell division